MLPPRNEGNKLVAATGLGCEAPLGAATDVVMTELAGGFTCVTGICRVTGIAAGPDATVLDTGGPATIADGIGIKVLIHWTVWSSVSSRTSLAVRSAWY